MNLALFDLDNTLLDGDSDFEWAQFLILKGVLDREIYEKRNTEFYDQYKAGVLNIDEFLDFQLKPLSLQKRAVLELWHKEFMKSRIEPIVSPKGVDIVQKHLAQGDLVAIVTATNSFITAPIAKRLGVGELIATELEIVDGEYTGQVAGIPCYREGKVARVQNWLEARGQSWGGFDKSFFYSDSLNDLPLLSRVTHPVAVDPDSILAAHAKTRSWPIISLRE